VCVWRVSYNHTGVKHTFRCSRFFLFFYAKELLRYLTTIKTLAAIYGLFAGLIEVLMLMENRKWNKVALSGEVVEQVFTDRADRADSDNKGFR